MADGPMKRLEVDSLSLRTCHLHCGFSRTDAVLGTATGSVFERNGSHFLVTNWHNVTGRRNDTGKCISETLAIPDLLITYFRRPERLDAASI